ncbi:MAG: hypothetical protein IJ783_11495 [Kiritimatiellae bacterium]|nr:hypothetical protein [Kiritimatiellia bacterium]
MPSPQPGTDFWEQPELTLSRATRAAARLVEQYRGPYGEVKAWADALQLGNAHPDAAAYKYYTLQSVDLTRDAGPSGTAVLVWTNAGVDDTASAADDARVLEVNWHLSTSPIDVSVYRYCGQSQGANANRARIEAWWNGVLSGEGVAADGTIDMPSHFNAGDRAIAAKLLAGREVVQRHYPTIVKTTLAGKGSLSPDGKLDHVIANGAGPAGAPAWMAGRAAQWLKIQEDGEQHADNTQTFVEAWIGGDDFDMNFYGNEAQSGTSGRWEFGTI